MFGILIDKNGFKLDFDMLETLQDKELKDGESIVEQDWAIANSMNKPKWDGEKWVDTDSLPEPEPIVPEPTFEELQMEYNVDLDYRLSIIEMGLQNDI